MKAFLLVTDEPAIIVRGYAKYDQAKPAMFVENNRRKTSSSYPDTVHIRAVDIVMDNGEEIFETYQRWCVKPDEYYIKILFALIGMPEQCPSCRCYDLAKTVEGQWRCANCKRTMIDCIKEGLIK